MFRGPRPSSNTVARTTVLAIPVVLGLAGWGTWAWVNSSYETRVGLAREQPVPFSRAHHVAGLGNDCRYCHTSVETSSFAGLPPTATCMNCHRQIWTNAELLAPVRQSYDTGEPIHWTRVYDLPEFVYFNHSIHVNKGIGCETCHGRIDQMPLTWRAQALHMTWCLDCHRNPAPNLRPRDAITTMGYQPAKPQAELGPELMRAYGIKSPRELTNCTVCHR